MFRKILETGSYCNLLYRYFQLSVKKNTMSWQSSEHYFGYHNSRVNKPQVINRVNSHIVAGRVAKLKIKMCKIF